MLRDAIRRALFAGAIAAVALPLQAQDVADAAGDAGAAPAPTTLDRITVTGSRISRAVDVETVQPVTVLTRQDMERSGVQSVADVLQNLVVMGSPAISRADALSSGEAVGGSYVDIRNLGAARTLVLVNGQRLGVTTGGLADVSQIPTSAVERIEVLKDGGSANYGSDAIAGVVNIITRRNVEGAEANVYFGQFDEGDGKKQTYDATFGLTSDLGWLTASMQYAKEDPVWAKDREYSASGNGPLHPLDGRSSITEKGVLFVPRTTTDGKVVYDRYTLKDGGNPADFADFRPYVGATDSSNPNAQMTLQTGQERRALYLDAGRKLTDSLTLHVDALYNQRDTMQQIAGYPFRSGGPVADPSPNDPLWRDWDPRLAPDSAFNPLPGQKTEYFRRTWEVPRVTMNKATTYRIGAKLSQPFDLGGLPWDWEAGAFQSQFRTVKDGTGNLFLPAAQKAAGASWFNVATNRYECGSAAKPIAYGSDFGNGQCIPWNPLAPYGSDAAGSLSDPELQKFLFPIGHDVGETETNSIFANVSGVLAELDAGELGFAAGYEHRQEKGFFSPDALRQSRLSTDLGSGNSGGQYHLDELYAEVNIPLLRDKPFANALALNLASRYSNYSTFGSTTRSKASVEWRPIADLLVRGTWGQGFRAPTIDDLYGPQNQSFEDYTDPCDTSFGPASTSPACTAVVPPGFRQEMSGGVPADGPNSQSNVPFLSGSNPNLQPELSRNMTVGFVYSPQQVDGLSIGLDWWKVRVDDAIVTDAPNEILDDCYVRGIAERCSKFTRNPTTGAISTLDFALVNLGYVETAGYDLLATYHLPEQRWGRLGFTWDTTYVDYYEQKSTNSASVPVQYAGTAGTFRMRSNLSADWSMGNYGVRWGLRHYSSITEACTYTAECSDPLFQAPYTNGKVTPRNKVGSNTFNDVQFRYATPWSSTVSLGVNNVFEKVGPMLYSKPNSSFPYYGGFDIGRFVYVQYQQKF
ncbi:TonB-dependent receptor [Lysobacter helvus]|uniref:TonB-dependent receptor n=2 Tax=Lysobacteraceae TaxID=32033 RepID=A0ABN6FPJ5_9GAMM|nr:TonB-dependent receptor [Lysobacter caseinilyticus]BCT94688.1 TonB-dependent receptor [Lysobacter helvus]